MSGPDWLGQAGAVATVVGGFLGIAFWAEYGERTMWRGVSRLFRRCPPHLRGRVPVDCGEGATIYHAWVEGDFIRVNHDGAWNEEPDDVGRAFLASGPPYAGPALPEAQGEPDRDQHWPDPDLPVPMDEWWRRIRAMDAQRQSVRSEQHEQMMAVQRRALGDIDAGLLSVRIILTPEDIERGRCKPSPAENARRYSQEEETW